MVSAADVVGSGPYEAEAFDAMRARMTRRRDGYWGNNAGFLDACNIILQPDDASRANALLDRTADIATLPAVLAQLFKGRPDFAVTTAPLTSRHVLFVNHTAVRYRDLRVRQAVSRALDRVAFYGPYGTGVAGGPMSPAAVTWAVPESDLRTLPGYRDRETDRKDAASLLGAAGTLPDGFEDTLLTSAAEGLPELASRMAVDLAEAGIHLRVVELGGDYRELQTRLAAGDFTLALGVAVAGPYPDAQLYAYHHSRSGGANYGKYINAALDAKLDRQRILLDANERVRLVQEIQKEIITNPGPAWIGSPLEWRVAGPHAGGARAHPFLAGYDDAERLSFRP
jgi:peptide/nickel transport system substrate-binding protein